MPMTNETLKEQLTKQLAQLEQERTTFEPHWRELSDFIIPRGSRFLTSEAMGLFSTLLTAPLSAYGAYKMGGGTWSPFTQSKAAPISAAVGTPTGR